MKSLFIGSLTPFFPKNQNGFPCKIKNFSIFFLKKFAEEKQSCKFALYSIK